jgi:hypothetical protein
MPMLRPRMRSRVSRWGSRAETRIQSLSAHAVAVPSPAAIQDMEGDAERDEYGGEKRVKAVSNKCQRSEVVFEECHCVVLAHINMLT